MAAALNRTATKSLGTNPILLLRKQRGPISVGFRKVSIQFGGSLVAGRGLLRASCLLQDNPQAIPGWGKIRLEFESPAVVSLGRGSIPAAVNHIAEVQISLGTTRIMA